MALIRLKGRMAHWAAFRMLIDYKRYAKKRSSNFRANFRYYSTATWAMWHVIKAFPKMMSKLRSGHTKNNNNRKNTIASSALRIAQKRPASASILVVCRHISPGMKLRALTLLRKAWKTTDIVGEAQRRGPAAEHHPLGR